MAEHNIEVNGKVNIDVQPSIAELKKLQKELKTTTDPGKFKQLQQEIDDMKESIAAAKSGAGNFAEVMGTLPGPIGDVSNKVGGLIGTLKQFSQMKTGDIKSSFVELGKEIGDVVKGFGKLTGLTQAYTSLNNGLAKSFKAVGISEGIATVGAQALSVALSALGIGLIVAAITALVDIISEWVTGTKAAEEATRKLNNELESNNRLLDLNQASFDRNAKERIAKMKASGATEKEIRAQQIKDAYTQYTNAFDAEKQARDLFNKNSKTASAEDYKKLSEDLSKKEKATKDYWSGYIVTGNEALATERKETDSHNKELSAKAEANRKAIAAKIQQEKDELIKGQEDSFKETLGAREKEEYEVNKKYSHLLFLATKYGEDTSTIKKAQRKELLTIDEKYTKEELDKKKEADDKATAKRKEQFELDKANLDLQRAQKLIDEDTYQSQLKDLKLKYAEGEVDSINAQVEYLNYIDGEKQKQLDKDKERAKEQQEINKAVQQSWIDLGGNIANTFRELGGLFEEGSDMAKTFGIISVLVNAATAIGKINLDFAEAISSKRKAISIATDAIAQGTAMFPLNPIVGGALIGAGTAALTSSSAGLAVLQANKGLQIASVALTSGAQIAAILSAKKSATIASGGSATAGGSTTPAPAYGGAPSAISTPQINTQGGANPATQISQTIQNASQNPVRAYVVSQDIQTQSALDRRTNRAATFGLG